MDKLIIIAGPTAVGKTALSLKVAEKMKGEIISADSMQVYKGMDIGTAKIRPEEMTVPHHLIDILDPKEDFNVVCFKNLAKEAVKDINSRGKIPIVCGGTGFYIQALLYDIDFTENDDDMSFREKLEREAAELGAEALHERLQKIDPESALKIHPNNVKRVIRALEFYEKSHKMISEHNKEQHENESPYDYRYYAVTDDRDLVYDRINRRVDLMLEDGLVDEVKKLLSDGVKETSVSMQGLGYKEIVEYLKGDISLDEAVYKLKRDTRHFAKRQLTWLRREKQVIWLDRSKMSEDEMEQIIVNSYKEV